MIHLSKTYPPGNPAIVLDALQVAPELTRALLDPGNLTRDGLPHWRRVALATGLDPESLRLAVESLRRALS